MQNNIITGYRGAVGPSGASIREYARPKVKEDGDTVTLDYPVEVHPSQSGAVNVNSTGLMRGAVAIVVHTGAADPSWPFNVSLPDGYVFTQGERRVYELTVITDSEVILKMLSPSRFSETVQGKSGTEVSLKAGFTFYYTGSETEPSFTLGSIQEIGGRAIISSTAASAPAITGATAVNGYSSRFDPGNPNRIFVERVSESEVIYYV